MLSRGSGLSHWKFTKIDIGFLRNTDTYTLEKQRDLNATRGRSVRLSVKHVDILKKVSRIFPPFDPRMLTSFFCVNYLLIYILDASLEMIHDHLKIYACIYRIKQELYDGYMEKVMKFTWRFVTWLDQSIWFIKYIEDLT